MVIFHCYVSSPEGKSHEKTTFLSSKKSPRGLQPLGVLLRQSGDLRSEVGLLALDQRKMVKTNGKP